MAARQAKKAKQVGQITLDLSERRRFPTDPREDLSAVAQSGPCLWLGCDETTALERVRTDDWRSFGDHEIVQLSDIFALPDDPDDEIDIEGLDFDGHNLWVTGSHSHTRKKPKPDKHAGEETLSRLATIKNEPNRYFLARIPLVPAEGGTIFEPDPRRAACLKMKDGKNTLVRALAGDPHLAPFLSIPCKENGFDIEGIAGRDTRAFIGCRGPVLRGWATVIEIEVKQNKPGRLKLRRIGDDGERYRKHFLDLGGLGVRDLAFDGDDLLIIAGPAMDHDGPLQIFRWSEPLAAAQSAVVPQGEKLAKMLDLPYGPGHDKAEGLAVLRRPDDKPVLLVVTDSPDPQRIHGDRKFDCDLFAMP